MTARTTGGYRRIATLFLATALLVSSMAGTAFGAVTPLSNMQIFSQPMGDVTMVQMLVAVPEGTSLPTTTQVIVPAEFTPHAVNGFSTANPSEILAPLEYETEETESGELLYTIELTETNGANLLFNVPEGIYVNTGSHNAAGLALMAPSDLEQLIYAFAVPAGTTPSGQDLVSFGTSADGSTVVGQVFDNVKEGDRPSASVVFVAADGGSGEATATPGAGGGFLSGSMLYWVLGGAGVLILAGIVVVIMVTRKPTVVEDVVYEDEDDEL